MLNYSPPHKNVLNYMFKPHVVTATRAVKHQCNNNRFTFAIIQAGNLTIYIQKKKYNFNFNIFPVPVSNPAVYTDCLLTCEAIIVSSFFFSRNSWHIYFKNQSTVFVLLATASKTYIGSVLFRTSVYTGAKQASRVPTGSKQNNSPRNDDVKDDSVLLKSELIGSV